MPGHVSSCLFFELNGILTIKNMAGATPSGPREMVRREERAVTARDRCASRRRAALR
jgi:hypothetical protein